MGRDLDVGLRAERVGEGHDGAPVQDARQRAQIAADLELGADLVRSGVGEAETQESGEEAFDRLLQLLGELTHGPDWSPKLVLDQVRFMRI